MRGLFVTGTDTGVGKTWIAAGIVQALRAEGRSVGVLKPVATGTSGGGDIGADGEALLEAAGIRVPPEMVVPLRFEAPLAPTAAARKEGRVLRWPDVEAAAFGALELWRGRGAEILVVEGIGGFLCPLAEGKTVADLGIALDFPVVVVSRRGLGALNHTLLTLEAVTKRGLRVAGLIGNSPDSELESLAEAGYGEEIVRLLGNVPLLSEIRHGLEGGVLKEALARVDWYGRAAEPRWSGDLARDRQSSKGA